MRWVLDLDGVVWLAGRPIAGAPEAVGRLRRAGHQVVLLTNNAGPTRAGFADALANAGVEAHPGELATSAQAAASMLAAGSTALVVGGDGLIEALDDAGIRRVGPGERPGAVVVGRSVDLDYDQLAAAATVLRGGARYVATNTDATFPTPDGLLPGAGALVAFLSEASGRQPEVAGKPHRPVVDLVARRYGPVDVMVGDRPDTDGAFARLAGARFVLVLSGVTTHSDLPVDPEPDATFADLAAAVDGLA